MTSEPLSYHAPSKERGRTALQSLGAAFAGDRAARLDESRTYHDTFDWRLYRARRVLWSTPDGWWTLAGRGGEPVRAHVSGDPAFAADFEGTPLAAPLAALASTRRLLPVLRSTRSGQLVALRDAEGKTVVRAGCEEIRVSDARPAAVANGAGAQGAAAGVHPLAVRLRLEPVRGYDGELDRVSAFVEHALSLSRCATSELDEALEVLGIQPDDPSRLRIAITPQMRADAAVELVHRELVRIVRVNEPGVRERLDTESLHDLRVAVRRTRSVLGQVKRVLPARVRAHYRAEFAWLGQLTGPARDLDVYLEWIGAEREQLPPERRGELDPFLELLAERRDAEQERLRAGLDSVRCARLIDGWTDFLEQPVPEQPEEAHAGRPVIEVAGRTIWKAYRRLLRGGRAIDADAPPEALHALRIEAKKLRYLLDVFRGLYAAEELDPLVRALKKLQDNLGNSNDTAVQIAALHRFARELHERGAPVETIMRLGYIEHRLEERGRLERGRFARRFGRFDSGETRRRFERLFGPASRPASGGRDDGGQGARDREDADDAHDAHEHGDAHAAHDAHEHGDEHGDEHDAPNAHERRDDGDARDARDARDAQHAPGAREQRDPPDGPPAPSAREARNDGRRARHGDRHGRGDGAGPAPQRPRGAHREHRADRDGRGRAARRGGAA